MKIKNAILFVLIMLSAFIFSSCEKDEPSVLKVFVRSSENVLTSDAHVRIVADLKEGTPEYFDEKKTNESGVAIFELDEFFDEYGKKDDKVAYFTVYAKDTVGDYTQGKARAKQHLTAIETITLE